MDLVNYSIFRIPTINCICLHMKIKFDKTFFVFFNEIYDFSTLITLNKIENPNAKLMCPASLRI